jgi:hypothetical protein
MSNGRGARCPEGILASEFHELILIDRATEILSLLVTADD